MPAPVLRAGELLERDDEILALEAALWGARGGAGRLVFVAGEAGVGKTALVTRFCDANRNDARVLMGACDPLFTPRPLGPFVDVAQSTGGELGELMRNGAIPYRVAETLLHELGREEPTVLIVEDLHWGDEATLDVVRILARRIEGARALVIATYRDDQLDSRWPLRVVLGGLATAPGITRLQLGSLSPAAVAHLAAPSETDADELYRLTSGNPFFVTEVLASVSEHVPETVRDAVLARADSLSREARLLLEAVSIAPSGAEPSLLEVLAGPVEGALGGCLASGMLTTSGDTIGFRHELARLTIEESISPDRRIALHRLVVATLEAEPMAVRDAARLAHHADAAGDAEAVLRFAPDAAARAAALGAHREAAGHYRRALRHAGGVSVAERASLLERYSHECYLTDEGDEAISALQQAAACYSELGDRTREGATLSDVASILWCPGRGEEARRVGLEAVTLLEQLAPGPELVRAYGIMSFLHSSNADLDGSSRWGDRELALAQELDLPDELSWALIGEGLRQVTAGSSEGIAKVERGLEIGRGRGLVEQRAAALVELVFARTHRGPFTLARGHIVEGITYTREHGLDLQHLYFLSYKARLELDQGLWADAAESAELVLGERFVSTFPRTLALVTLGLVRARRGDPEVGPMLDEAHALSAPTGELPRIAPVAAAKGEAAWLTGRTAAVAAETDAAFNLALERGAPWALGELATVRWRAGIDDELPSQAAEPHRLQISGEWQNAAARWRDLDCPYESALALGDSNDQSALRQAYDELRSLGARPAAEMIARRLRQQGARGLRRGPRPTTRKSAAGLTTRETDVLELLADGLRNADIADRLFISRRTVDHHVSTLLRKLDARTRGEAVAAARRRNLLQER